MMLNRSGVAAGRFAFSILWQFISTYFSFFCFVESVLVPKAFYSLHEPGFLVLKNLQSVSKQYALSQKALLNKNHH
jgi:hypothetical protein